MNSKWISVYIYYEEPWEDLLVDAIKPLTESLIKEGIVESFFFVRYWHKGAHIRFRLLTPNKRVVKSRVDECLISYFSSNPRERPLIGAGQSDFYPTNSLQYIPYNQEIKRYGGRKRMVIAEEQFRYSSVSVLSMLSHRRSSWCYEDVLGASIQFHFSFVHAYFGSIPESIKFLKRIETSFGVNTSQISQKGETIYEKGFLEHKEALEKQFKVLWNKMEGNEKFNPPWLFSWWRSMSYIKNKLKATTKGTRDGVPVGIPASYIHMTNNRLGVLFRDESYLAYLTRRTLESM